MPTVRFAVRALLCGSIGGLNSCGLLTPSMQNFGGDQDHSEAVDENLILNQIKCEIHQGVYDTLYDPNFYPSTPTNGKSVEWLRDWGAKVTYIITVDEKSSFNPGVSYKNPFRKMGTFFSLGGGLQISSEAQRRETGAVTYDFKDLLKDPRPSNCEVRNGVLIHSNLKIADFISNKVFTTRVPGTVPTTLHVIDTSKPQVLNAFSDELTFTVIYGGSATPTWNFIRLSVDPVAPLISAARSKIQYASITLGPVTENASPVKAARLAPEAELIDQAHVIGRTLAPSLQGTGITSTP